MSLPHCSPSQDSALTKTNPATGDVLATYPCDDISTVSQAIEAARQCQSQWAATPFRTRAQVLHALADALVRDADMWAQLIVDETGKPYREAYETDLMGAIGQLRFYANVGPKVLKTHWSLPDKGWLFGRFSQIRRVPKGLVGIISPWNYPLVIIASATAAALMSGNGAILKPSEWTPGVGLRWGTLVRDTLSQFNIDPNLVAVLTGAGSVGQAIVDHPAINHVQFTGSARVGQSIYETVARRMATCTLEMGGSDPAIILDSAQDLDTFTSMVLWGRYANSGQTCAAVKRLLVHQRHYNRVLDLLSTKLVQLHVGSPDQDNPLPHMGALIHPGQVEAIQHQLQQALNQGGRLVFDGGSPQEAGQSSSTSSNDNLGYFVTPKLVADVPHDAPIWQDELFGPVLLVTPFNTDDEAITLANGTPYGLGASIFGERTHAYRLASSIQAGMIAINDIAMTQYAMASVPWVGHKASGLGCSHGLEGLLELTIPQSILTSWGHALPFFQKPPWVFGTESGIPFARSMVQTLGQRSFLSAVGLPLMSFFSSLLSQRSRHKI